MTVYVDNMHTTAMGKFRHMKMSHMICDDIDELHEMAEKIGVRRKWFQGDHYDVCMEMRDKAIKLGAVEISMRQLAAMSWNIKRGIDCTPENAIQKMLEGINARKNTA